MKSRDIVFVADNIRSLENIGSLFRIADGIGAREVISIGISGYPDIGEKDERRPWLRERNTKFIKKTALSGLDTVRPQYFSDVSSCIHYLRSNNYFIVSVELTKDSVSYIGNYTVGRPCAIVLGNEIDGVCDEFLSQSDLVLSIPMDGMGVSLNVSVAAGIIGYEIARRFDASSILDR